MRLICPNCSAQYEIDGSLIPEEGRDVQCSNCGKTWFELPGASAEREALAAVAEAEPPLPEDPIEDDLGDEDLIDEYPGEAREASESRFAEDDDRSAFEDRKSAEEEDWSWPETTARADPIDEDTDRAAEAEAATPTAASMPDIADETGNKDDDWRKRIVSEPWPEPGRVAPDWRTAAEEASEATPEPASAPEPEPEPEPEVAAAPMQKRPADVAALDVLREEAEREIERRRSEAPEALETQEELGLDEHRNRATPSRALRARMARLKSGAEDDHDAPDDDDSDYTAPRRDLLPDIEEINSSLRPSRHDDGDEAAAEAAERQSGFRMGFGLMVVIAGLLIVGYAWAPMISEAVPAARAPLAAYVDWANGVRDALGATFGGTKS